MPIVKLYGVSPVSPSPGFDSIGYSLATGCLLTAYCLWQVYYQISMDSSWKISRSFCLQKKKSKNETFWAVSGPYRGRIGMTLDTRPYWDHSLSKNEM